MTQHECDGALPGLTREQALAYARGVCSSEEEAGRLIEPLLVDSASNLPMDMVDRSLGVSAVSLVQRREPRG